MQFTTPTTKQEMYTTLQAIYSYYRLQMQGYTPAEVESLSLYRITFTPLTDAELLAKAEVLVKAKNEERKIKRKESLKNEIAKANAKLSLLSAQESALLAEINDRYDDSEDKIRAEASKKGYSNSSILLNALTALETARNGALASASAEYSAKSAEYTATVTSATSALSSVSTYFSDVFTAEKNAEFKRLKDAQDEKIIAVNKFNASQDEKEQRLDISVSLQNADQQLKFLSLRENSYSKEQLVDMGYFADVLACITGYYDTLSTASARYSDFLGESRLAFYLEDYYPDILYMYKTAAGF